MRKFPTQQQFILIVLSSSLRTAFPDLQITSPPQEVVTGETVQLPCFAEGSPLQDVKWEFTDVFGNLQYTLEYIITDHDSDSGVQNVIVDPSSEVSESSVEDQYVISPPDDTTQLYGMLTVKNITAFQAGEYKCTLTNVYNTDSYSASVDVQSKSFFFLFFYTFGTLLQKGSFFCFVVLYGVDTLSCIFWLFFFAFCSVSQDCGGSRRTRMHCRRSVQPHLFRGGSAFT